MYFNNPNFQEIQKVMSPLETGFKSNPLPRNWVAPNYTPQPTQYQ